MEKNVEDKKIDDNLEKERKEEEEEEESMDEEEEEGEERMDEEGLVINSAPLEGGERILGEKGCPAFLSNESKAVDLLFNVVPGIEVIQLNTVLYRE
jgi:hypothetical protein